jgi:lysophospholipase L1-like esterase
VRLGHRAATGATLLAAVALGTRALLHAQARTARTAIGQPLGEEAFHPSRTYRRKHGQPVTLVMLGDSVAAGLGASRPRHTLGVRLAKGLGRATGRAVRLVPCAEVGAESSWLARQVEAIPDEAVPDVAVIVVGGNDVTHRVRLVDSVAALEDAVRSLRELGAEVVVGTCPDLGALVLVPQPLRSLARQASRRLAVAQHQATIHAGGHPVSLSDAVGSPFLVEPETMFALDGFHPSSRGYRRIAQALLPTVVASVEVSGVSGSPARRSAE